VLIEYIWVSQRVKGHAIEVLAYCLKFLEAAYVLGTRFNSFCVAAWYFLRNYSEAVSTINCYKKPAS